MTRAIKSYTLHSPILSAEVLTMGAALKSFKLKGADGPPLDLIWDLGNLEAYRKNPASAGVVVGRVAGRIADGLLRLGGRRLRLAHNENGHTLHGGPGGFGWQNWQWAGKVEGGQAFRYASLHGDQGFPGHLDVRATYTMPEDHILRLDLLAKSRATTPVDLTHHPYWVFDDAEVKGSESQMCDETLIPTGGYGPFELNLAQPLDHCVKVDGEGFQMVGKIIRSEVSIEIWSDADHLQVYNGKAGYLCLEPQGANNIPQRQLLNAGKIWRRRIEYRVKPTA